MRTILAWLALVLLFGGLFLAALYLAIVQPDHAEFGVALILAAAGAALLGVLFVTDEG